MAIAAVPRETPRPVSVLDEILLELIDVDDNVRIDVGELEELKASIHELGVLQAIKVTAQPNGRYRLVYGQRRVLASRELGRLRILAIIEPPSDVDVHGARRSIEQLSENLQRKDLNPIEEAVALREVLDATKGLTQDALADKLGMSRPWVSNTLGLLRAPAKVQELVREAKLTAAHVKALSGLPADDQVRLANVAIREEQSAHELERNAKWARERAGEAARDAKVTTDAVKRGLEALEAAGLAKDAPLFVYAEHWQVRDDEVRKALREAGYSGVSDGWARSGDRWSKCDCTARQLRIRDGKGSTIDPVCTSDKHWAALEKERTATQREKTAADEAERKRLVAFVRAAMPAEINTTIARLILRSLDGMYAKTWTEYSKLKDHQVIDAIADKLTSESALRGSSYNGDNKRLPVRTVVRELGGGWNDDTPLPAKPKRAKKAAG
jgi:ParB/RepB/Spo0J family partition protein